MQDQFPEDQYLRDLGIDSYMGVSLSSTSGQQLGIILLEHTSTIPDPHQAELILKIVAPRAAAELEHTWTENALRHSEERFRALVEFGYEGMTILTEDLRIA